MALGLMGLLGVIYLTGTFSFTNQGVAFAAVTLNTIFAVMFSIGVIIFIWVIFFYQSSKLLYNDVYPHVIKDINVEHGKGLTYQVNKNAQELVKGSSFKGMMVWKFRLKFRLNYVNALNQNIEIYEGYLNPSLSHSFMNKGFHILVQNDDFDKYSFYQDTFEVTHGFSCEEETDSVLELRYRQVFTELKALFPKSRIILNGIDKKVIITIKKFSFYKNIKHLDEKSYQVIKDKVMLLLQAARLANNNYKDKQ